MTRKQMKYTGPAKPISLDFEQHSPWERAQRIVFLLALIAVGFDLTFWRP